MGKIIYIGKCPDCKGTGQRTVQQLHSAAIRMVTEPCPFCRGRGMRRLRLKELGGDKKDV